MCAASPKCTHRLLFLQPFFVGQIETDSFASLFACLAIRFRLWDHCECAHGACVVKLNLSQQSFVCISVQRYASAAIDWKVTLFILSVYLPTYCTSPKTKDNSSGDLSRLIRSLDALFVAGDLNSSSAIQRRWNAISEADSPHQPIALLMEVVSSKFDLVTDCS